MILLSKKKDVQRQKNDFPIKEYIIRMSIGALIFSTLAALLAVFTGFNQEGLSITRKFIIITDYIFISGGLVSVAGGILVGIANIIQIRYARMNKGVKELKDQAYKERFIGKSLIAIGSIMLAFSVLVTLPITLRR